ncbi:MAG: ATP-binding cassette domain-containing protein [Actinomycetia bacterium]|nr:ATP-binding cassette domain-containing protein [Actinomycetes bacterium]
MSASVSIRKRLASFTLDVDLQATSETVGLLGASGSGKSMTLRCIAGLERPDEGRIVVGGRTFFDSERGIDLSPQERKSALLFQNYQLFPSMTVAENIASGIDRAVTRDDRRQLIAGLLDTFHLRGLQDRYPAKLSGGQQQRVALARMLAARPPILMLDEPFTALDEHLKASFEQELLETFGRFEGTILYVSHDIDEAFRFCDRIAVINDGHVEDVGLPGRIVSHPQSLAALRLSGCKNISPATRLDEHWLFAESWGIRLRCDEPVPHGLTHVGIRAFFVSRAEQDTADNVFHAVAVRTSESRYERTVMLAVSDDTSRADSERYIHWKIDKLQPSPDGNVGPGDRVTIKLPGDRLHLVCGSAKESAPADA